MSEPAPTLVDLISAAQVVEDQAQAPEVAQVILRHAKVTTTLGVYTHVNLAQQREAAAALDQLLGEVLG